jgi:uncharacterized glyoxalase superfamily protein PhnB
MEQQVIPYPLYEDGAAAVEFLTEAFGFREKMRTAGEGGGFHAELEIAPGGGLVYLGQPSADFRNPAVVSKTSLVYVIVDDVDGHYARAKAAGAQIISEPEDQSYGFRHYGCADPQGHEWWFAQPLAKAESDA